MYAVRRWEQLLDASIAGDRGAAPRSSGFWGLGAPGAYHDWIDMLQAPWRAGARLAPSHACFIRVVCQCIASAACMASTWRCFAAWRAENLLQTIPLNRLWLWGNRGFRESDEAQGRFFAVAQPTCVVQGDSCDEVYSRVGRCCEVAVLSMLSAGR